jgi:hypothetical protein
MPLMAKSVVVLTSCDQPHDGDERVTDGVITIEFGYEGKTYATELCAEHVEEYHHWMQDYLAQGARVISGGEGKRSSAGTGPAKRGRGRARQTSTGDVSAIREWARENGHAVSSRGRIPGEVRAAYDAAH